ncbi:hypothetical protein V8B55DRAFT_1507427 [Mucor lusitanicus]|uniref:Nudix hydrolase domain-containing protein n=2 Tax=Mucor circinelloides f. lusitanicus TaxID=29924 RepID=A0A162RST5_MUCCL|nr:hypothetical protein FB192DRAFT_1369122 [Mucor lusitanicus]OAD08499.1 hypothetical protein MUCCIDRAFT_188080 [Mucor lusitanicus CBS 277.49]
MISNTENNESVPVFLDIDEDELKQVIYGLPIDPRSNRIMLTSMKDKEQEKWVLPKCEVESHENQEPEVHREVYEQAGVRGQIVGLVGSFYECGKKGKPKSHIKIYELQIDELFKKWPDKKRRERRWFSYQEVLELLANKPYLIESLQQTCFANSTVIDRPIKPTPPPPTSTKPKDEKKAKRFFRKVVG